MGLAEAARLFQKITCFSRKSTLHVGFTNYGFNLSRLAVLEVDFPKFPSNSHESWWIVPYWPSHDKGSAEDEGAYANGAAITTASSSKYFTSEPKISYKAVISSFCICFFTILDLVRFFCSINVCGFLGTEKHSESNAQHFRAEALHVQCQTLTFTVFHDKAQDKSSTFKDLLRVEVTAEILKWKHGIPNILPSHKLFDSCATLKPNQT